MEWKLVNIMIIPVLYEVKGGVLEVDRRVKRKIRTDEMAYNGELTKQAEEVE